MLCPDRTPVNDQSKDAQTMTRFRVRTSPPERTRLLRQGGEDRGERRLESCARIIAFTKQGVGVFTIGIKTVQNGTEGGVAFGPAWVMTSSGATSIETANPILACC